jgi:pSer/pThr/pTyr-binding forkhead associated (FHA) protein
VSGHNTLASSFDADPPRRRGAEVDGVDAVGAARVGVGTQGGRTSGAPLTTRDESETDDVDAEGTESAMLVARRGPNAGFRCPLDQAVTTLGRHPDCDVVLDAVTVSPRHAELRRHGADVVLVDVGSFNGTYVNGVLSDVAVLADGDEVQIGKFRLVFRAARARYGIRRAVPEPLLQYGKERGRR